MQEGNKNRYIIFFGHHNLRFLLPSGLIYVSDGEKENTPLTFNLQKKEINLVQPLDVCQSYV